MTTIQRTARHIGVVKVRGAAPIDVFTDGRRIAVIAGCTDVEFTKAEWRKLLPILVDAAKPKGRR
jgi:hypothetical protein